MDPFARRYTEDEYLVFERAAEWRHELHGDRIVLAQGAPPGHITAMMNVACALFELLERREWHVMMRGMRVRTPGPVFFAYPDVLIYPDAEAQFESVPGDDMLLNPAIIVEVVSAESKAVDFGSKKQSYFALPSLTDYLLIDEYSPLVEHFRRQPDGRWTSTVAAGLDAKVTLPTLGCDLTLAEVYDDVFERQARYSQRVARPEVTA